MPQTLIPGAILSMTAEAADRLLRAGSGDGALLYLHLLRHGDLGGLNWNEERKNAALSVLQSLQLAPQLAPVPAPAPLPAEQPLPTYSLEEITQALGESASPFTLVADEVERQLGKKLNATDLKILYTLYDHLDLPPEVILMLTTHCVEEHQRKFGAGRKPFLSVIKKEGFRWAKQGVETVERAEEYLQKQSVLRSREVTILQVLDIASRPLVAMEQNHIVQWLEMGFPDDSIRMAYEKTIMKKGSLDWNYLTGILKNWHSKNVHSVAEIQAGDRSATSGKGQVGFRPQGGPPPSQPQQAERARDDMERMRRMMEQMKREEG